eukprot:COSAG01_NODE_2808_length_7041_cov_6.709664_9_plen_102_part_00
MRMGRAAAADALVCARRRSAGAPHSQSGVPAARTLLSEGSVHGANVVDISILCCWRLIVRKGQGSSSADHPLLCQQGGQGLYSSGRGQQLLHDLEAAELLD